MRSLLGIICLLLVGVIFGPTLASSGVGRRLILSQINRHIQGKLDITDWSLHWTGGIEVRGLCLYDQQHVPVVSIEKMHTQLTLWNALRSRFHCGDTQLDGLDLAHLVIHRDGSTNLEQILKNQPAATMAATTATTHAAHHTAEHHHEVPIVSGDFHIAGLKGNILYERFKDGPIIIDPSDSHVQFADLNQPITQSGNVAVRIEKSASSGTVTWKGQIKLLDGQRVDMAASQIDASAAFDHFEAGGVTLEKFHLPLKLADGILRFETNTPITFNGGQLNLHGLTVNWASGDPRLMAPANYVLVHDASINPLLGDSLGKYINPVFTNTRRAEGKFDVILPECDGVALSDLIKTEQSGTFTAIFSLHDMNIVNPLGSQMISEVRKSTGGLNLAKMLGVKTTTRNGAKDADVFDGEIDKASVKLEHGRIDEDITLQLSESNVSNPAPPMLLRFIGQVKLHDQSQKLDVTLPAHFVSRSIGNKQFAELLDDLFPEGIPISLRGTTKSPKLDISRTIVRYNKKSKGDHSDKDDLKPLNDLLDQLAVPAKHRAAKGTGASTEPSTN